MRPFSLSHASSGTPEVDRQLRPLRWLANALADVAILNGRHIEDTKLTNGAVNKLQHKLGRKLKGWIVTDLRGATATGRIVRVLSSAGAEADDAKDLWLDVAGWGADVTVRLWCY